jgi:hypothetical protein
MIGHLGTQQMAAVSLGSLAVSFATYTFGFLVFLTTPKVRGLEQREGGEAPLRERATRARGGRAPPRAHRAGGEQQRAAPPLARTQNPSPSRARRRP